MSKRIAVLCSGGGSNMQAILDAIDSGKILGEVVLVLSNRKMAFALERARKRGIETLYVGKAAYPNADSMNDAILMALQRAQIDLVVLAGYLSIVGERVIAAYPNAILNIHPALIPSFCGLGMYGRHVHEAVLAYGAKISGATVHFVNKKADDGPIVMQKAVPVLDDDDATSLAARVLLAEHEILPKCVAAFCAEKIRVEGRRVFMVQ